MFQYWNTKDAPPVSYSYMILGQTLNFFQGLSVGSFAWKHAAILKYWNTQNNQPV